MEAKLKNLPDSEVTKLVNDAIRQNNMKPTSKEKNEIEAKGEELRGYDAALANHLYDRLLSGGYVRGYKGGNFVPTVPLPWDLMDEAAAIKAYHDMVLGYDLTHHIVAAYDPRVKEILESIAKVVEGKSGGASKNDTKKAESKPTDSKKLQLATSLFDST